MGFSRFMKALEVKPTDDEFEAIETTRWGNKVGHHESAIRNAAEC